MGITTGFGGEAAKGLHAAEHRNMCIYIYICIRGTLRASCLATFCLRYLPLRFGFVPSAVGVSGLHEGDLGL